MTQPKSATRLAAIALSTLGAALCSIQLAIATESKDTKARLLADIAFQYADLGASERSTDLLEEAIPLVKTMGAPCFQANPLSKIAGSYFLLKQNNQAHQFLETSVQTARTQLATGCSSSATSPTESLMNRAKEYGASGHFDLAMGLGHQLGDPVTLAELSGQLAKAGQSQRAEENLTQAMAIAMAIPDQWLRRQTLIVMARQLQLANQPTQALRVLEQAVENIGKKPTASSERALQIGSVLQIVRSFAALEADAQALKVLDQVMPDIQALPIKSLPLDKIIYQVDAASRYAELDQKSRSKSILADALTTARTLPNDSNRSRAGALRQVAFGYAELGDIESATTIAQSIQSAGEKDSATRAIALAYARIGNPDAAVKLAKSSNNQNGILMDIVRYYLTQKQPEQAWNFVQKHQVKGISAEVALGYVEAGQPEKASALLKTQPEEWVVPEVARGFAKQKQLDLALQAARSIKDKTYRTQALIAIAQGYGQSRAGKSEGLMSHWLNFIQGVFGDSEQEKVIKVLDEAVKVTRSL